MTVHSIRSNDSDVDHHPEQRPLLDPLDALFRRLAEDAADPGQRAGDDGDPVQTLCEAAATAGGVALVEDLLAAGFAPAAIAAACSDSLTDKRIKPKLRAGIVSGHRLIWLRSSGWQAVGQPNRRETPPTKSSLRHRLAAPNLEKTLLRKVDPVARTRGVMLSVVRDAEMRKYCDERKGDAWTVIQSGRQTDKEEAGRVLGGVYPDLLVVESWDPTQVAWRQRVWESSGDITAYDAPVSSEWGVAVEIELSAKSSPMLAHKIRQHDTAMSLQWWSSVCWITDDLDVYTRLMRAGAGTNPGHYLLLASTAGLAPAEGWVLPDNLRRLWWRDALNGF